MKRNSFVLFVICFTLALGSAKADSAGPQATVNRYIQALKSGDVDTIQDLIGGTFQQKRNTLLQQNKDYSEFLSKIYRKAEFRVGEMTTRSNEAFVNVEILFPEGNTTLIRLMLRRDAKGNWKIHDETDPSP